MAHRVEADSGGAAMSEALLTLTIIGLVCLCAVLQRRVRRAEDTAQEWRNRWQEDRHELSRLQGSCEGCEALYGDREGHGFAAMWRTDQPHD